jgi:hypothetical protein
MDASLFALNFGKALRGMWQVWCQAQLASKPMEGQQPDA